MKGIGGAGRKAILQQLGGFGPNDKGEDNDSVVNRVVTASQCSEMWLYSAVYMLSEVNFTVMCLPFPQNGLETLQTKCHTTHEKLAF